MLALFLVFQMKKILLKNKTKIKKHFPCLQLKIKTKTWAEQSPESHRHKLRALSTFLFMLGQKITLIVKMNRSQERP